MLHTKTTNQFSSICPVVLFLPYVSHTHHWSPAGFMAAIRYLIHCGIQKIYRSFPPQLYLRTISYTRHAFRRTVITSKVILCIWNIARRMASNFTRAIRRRLPYKWRKICSNSLVIICILENKILLASLVFNIISHFAPPLAVRDFKFQIRYLHFKFQILFLLFNYFKF